MTIEDYVVLVSLYQLINWLISFSFSQLPLLYQPLKIHHQSTSNFWSFTEKHASLQHSPKQLDTTEISNYLESTLLCFATNDRVPFVRRIVIKKNMSNITDHLESDLFHYVNAPCIGLSLRSLCCVFSTSVNVVDFCGQTIRGDGMIVNSHQESKKYYFVTMATDCHLTMQASSSKDKVQFHFRFFLVYSLLRVAPLSPAPVFPESPRGSAPLNPRLEPTSGESSGDPCHSGSYVQFYDGRDRSSPPLGPPLCGKSLPRPVLSTGNFLTLRLVTRGTQPRVDFVGDFTSFRLGM